MASPSVQLYRLPDEATARQILNAALLKNSAKSDTPETKARRNLYKGIDWTYKGLGPLSKVKANDAYQAALKQPAADLGTDFGTAKNDIDIERVLNAIRALSVVSDTTQHSGHTRYAELTAPQLTAIDTALLSLGEHLKAMKLGTHNDIIDTIFPEAKGKEKPEAIRTRVIKVFELALESVHVLRSTKQYWYFDKAVEIKVDSYGPAISVGGLANTGGITLSPNFFTNSAFEREATLLHESTHTIKDSTYRTADAGGYIGFAKFEEATLQQRYENASHFEAVVRLINKEVLQTHAPSKSTADTGMAAAQATIQAAWTKGLNLYGTMQRHGTSVVTDKAALEEMYRVTRLFGLSGYQGVDRTKLPPRSFSTADLAAIENRVGKLGVMLDAGNLRRAVQALTDAGTVNTEDSVLLQLVENEGTIRKTANPEKTVGMIKVLANYSAPEAEKFFVKYPVKVI